MMSESESQRQLQVLIDSALYGTISRPELARLEEWLRRYLEALTYYRTYLEVHADLYWIHKGQEPALPPFPDELIEKRRRRRLVARR